MVGLPFKLTDYLELVDLTGRIIRDDKRGAIDISLAPILQRIGLTSEQWLTVITQFGDHFSVAIGNEEDLAKFSLNTDR